MVRIRTQTFETSAARGFTARSGKRSLHGTAGNMVELYGLLLDLGGCSIRGLRREYIATSFQSGPMLMMASTVLHAIDSK